MANFCEMDFMSDIVILVKVDEMCNILKSASHVYWSRDEMEMDDQSFFG